MAKTKESSGRLAHGLRGHVRIWVCAVAARIQALLTKPALAAANRKRNNYTIANREILDLRPKFNHLAHVLMAKDISALHRRLVSVEEMQVGPANRTSGDFDDCIARMLDAGIRHGVNANIAFSVPAERAHR
jgi:hypothetical protein